MYSTIYIYLCYIYFLNTHTYTYTQYIYIYTYIAYIYDRKFTIQKTPVFVQACELPELHIVAIRVAPTKLFANRLDDV